MFRRQSRLRQLFVYCVRAFFKIVFKFIYRLKVEGTENIPTDCNRLIIVANHAALVDGLLVWTCLDRLQYKILVSRERAQERLLKFFMQNEYTVQIHSMNPYALKNVIAEINRGTPLLVFPEGHVTRTGNLMKIYEGTGFAAIKTGAKILPLYIKGTYKSTTSRKPQGKKLFTPVTIKIGAPRGPIEVEHLPPRQRKKEAAKFIYDLFCEMEYEANNDTSTLAREFVRICKERRKSVFFKDTTGKEVRGGKVLLGAVALGRYCTQFPERHIGLMLPNITATVLLFIGLTMYRKIPAFLNYSGGAGPIQHALSLAGINTVITSRQFLERVKLTTEMFGERRVIFLEDLREQIGLKEKITAFVRACFTKGFEKMTPGEEHETAVILFTSGSEGLPKGVMLSHENILSNIYQTLTRVDIRENDYVLNSMPLFHSFGLTMGTFLPLFAGAKVYLYVSPLHYRIVPEIAYEEQCTIIYGTNTFLNGYSRRAHPYDFYTVRFAYCGAEALSDDVFDRYAKVFGVRIMSGYGATECSPVISINNGIEHEYGTVGRILPGIEHKLVPVEGIDDKGGSTGKLFVRGKNVMKGYLKDIKKIEVDEGWYDTGDIVEITERGFLKIVGRLKRFAKISGEMISLAAIEDALKGVFGDRKDIAVVPVADERKGERLIVVTNNQDVATRTVRSALRERGFSDLAVPREVIFMRDIPKLGTGKIDYVKLGSKIKTSGS